MYKSISKDIEQNSNGVECDEMSLMTNHIIKNTAIDFVKYYWDGSKSGIYKPLNELLGFDDGGVSAKWSMEECINEIINSKNGLELALWFLNEMIFWRGYSYFRKEYRVELLNSDFEMRKFLKIGERVFQIIGIEDFREVFPIIKKVKVWG